jgi:hypothetical protein
MVWTLEALKVHFFPIRLTLRRNFGIKHMKSKHSATEKSHVINWIIEIKHMFRVNKVQQQSHMLKY